MKHIDGEFEYKGFKCQLAMLSKLGSNETFDACCVFIYAHNVNFDRNHFTKYMLPHIYHTKLFKDNNVPMQVQDDLEVYIAKYSGSLTPKIPEPKHLKAELLDELSASEDKISPALRSLLKDLFYTVDKCLKTDDAVTPNCFDLVLNVIHFINTTYSNETDRACISILITALQSPEDYDWTW
jgi:hypothetical protein